MKFFALLLGLFLLGTQVGLAQDWAKANLDKSPRHHDWVTIKSGDRNFKAFVAYPESKGKVPAILVIHENVGLTDWVRSLADEMAGAGYIVVAPDLLNGQTYTSQDDARKAVAALDPVQVTADLQSTAEYVSAPPSSNHKLVVAGFCWGGGQAFRFATNNSSLKAAFVFYGVPPEAADMAKITAPVYGFYGGNDARITSTVEATEKQMKEAHQKYDPETYAGAGHGFMRAGEAPDANAANKKARAAAWDRFVTLMKKIK